jgi:hypothetical protein
MHILKNNFEVKRKTTNYMALEESRSVLVKKSHASKFSILYIRKSVLYQYTVYCTFKRSKSLNRGPSSPLTKIRIEWYST